jgi:hypothetical protein
VDAWNARFVACFEHYQALIEAGTLTEPEATRQHLHQVMVDIAPGLRLRYDHLEAR